MSLTIRNAASYVAQFIIHKGDLQIAHLPGIEPDAQMVIPTDDANYEVVASTLVDGNTYTSAPQNVSGSAGFLAQVLQVPAQGTYEFDLKMIPPAQLNALTFQKTCLGAVMFTLAKDGHPLQNVVVQDSFQTQVLKLDDTITAYAIINGITTATVSTTNPSAVITATQENSGEITSFTLTVE